ncbi:MAG: hypothetical protein OEY28_08920 [Nitrospira sp.]|nr:hypothetical protein [Nitrospira sp.]
MTTESLCLFDSGLDACTTNCDAFVGAGRAPPGTPAHGLFVCALTLRSPACQPGLSLRGGTPATLPAALPPAAGGTPAPRTA